ncbi:methyl-accepting chemotaxis protein [Caldinitratiruptor microaerophilus]|uniref:Methyl-accepting transducer domain-containing protein n=1 Tax=Caldinitratiruptor microaerophilus TaxID=671077 RepID=A0AA35G9L0_9FIRM|nr:methyl-accepting chemotaxis protein [Caldinitratiruptor microaerophilus]BDG61578.1 hypothetical protein caldi_26680 [Caldinitratiruptor microaerophilus]
MLRNVAELRSEGAAEQVPSSSGEPGPEGAALATLVRSVENALAQLAQLDGQGPALQGPELERISRILQDFRAQLRASLVGLEGVISRAAVGAARSSVRIRTVAGHMEEVHRSVETLAESTRQVQGGADQVARAATEAAGLAAQVERMTGEGRQITAEALAAIRRLRDQSQAMAERLGQLVERMREITQVSGVIESIAAQTKLLALNAAIEAARAGVHGRGFAVVADEVRKLAEGTAKRAREIGGLVQAIRTELEPSQQLIREAVEQAREGAGRAEAAGAALEAIDRLARETAGHMQDIASAVEEQNAATESVFEALRDTVGRIRSVKEETENVSRETFTLSALTEEAYGYLGPFRTGTIFHRALALARELDRRCRAVFEEAIDQGRISLESVLELRYTEIKGAAVRRLARLFDVSRVPPQGFTPPKYSTAYDAVVDEALQRHMDEILGREPKLIFALVIDLNTYAPIHNSIYCKDWTGVPEKDLVGNRIKRFFHDQGVLVRGARVGLGPAALRLPNVASREDFLRAGCDLREPPGGSQDFLVQTYARDTGAVTAALTIPFFVKGHRYGAVLLGWTDDGSR